MLQNRQLLTTSDKHDLRVPKKTTKKARKPTHIGDQHKPDDTVRDKKLAVETTDSDDIVMNTEKGNGDTSDPILAASADIRVSTQIPDNFESLYKTAISCEDGEGVKFSISDDSTKATCDENADKFDNSGSYKDTKLGRNMPRDTNSEGSGVSREGSESDETNGTDETEGASFTREDLALNFDEDNAEMLKLEKGLTALCVGM